ncbi:MAG: oligosaccharide flippase family protein [Anaeromyxobacteraceae bacterium]
MASDLQIARAVTPGDGTAIQGQAGRGSDSASPMPVSGSMMRGSLWSMGGFAAGQALRFAGNLLLTRLLFPAAFGEMALVATLVQGLQLFSDVGIGPAIVQGARGDDPRFLKTAWTVQCARGVVLWVLSLLIARPVAGLYGRESLAWYIPVAALCAVFGGFESIAVSTQQRHVRLERLTLIDFSTQAITVLATVLLAVVVRSHLGPDHPAAVWALVGGTLVGNAARLAMTHLVLPRFHHGFLLERDALATLFGFGRWIFFSTLLFFLAGQADRLVLGKLIPMDLLGVYGIAIALASLPTQAVQRLAASVLFPSYSRISGQLDFARSVQRARMPVLLSGATLVTGLIACGPFLVRGLYDNRYAEASWMVQLLAASAWLQLLESTNGAVLLAKRLLPWHAASYASKVVGLVLLVPAGFWAGGLRGAILGLVAADAAKYVVSATGVARCGVRVVWRDAGLTALIALLSAGAIAVGSIMYAGWGPLAGFLGAGATAVAAWATVAAPILLRRRRGEPSVASPGTPEPIWTAGAEPGREP